MVWKVKKGEKAERRGEIEKEREREGGGGGRGEREEVGEEKKKASTHHSGHQTI